MQPDGVWKVADSGDFVVQDDQLELHYDTNGTVTTFAWARDGDTLQLEWKAFDSDVELKGIPDEAFWRAYLTKPLTRVPQ
jgi:hypothetical protein